MNKIFGIVLFAIICGCGRWTLDNPTEPVAKVALQRRGSYTLPGPPHSICLRWPYAFVAFTTARLQVISFANPDAPALASTTELIEGTSFIAVEGSLLYAQGHLLSVYDASNVAAVHLIDSMPFSPVPFQTDGNCVYYTAGNQHNHLSLYKAIVDTAIHVIDTVDVNDISPRLYLPHRSLDGTKNLYTIGYNDMLYRGVINAGKPFYSILDSMPISSNNGYKIAGDHIISSHISSIDCWPIYGDGSLGDRVSSQLPSNRFDFTCGSRIAFLATNYRSNIIRLFLMNISNERMLMVAYQDAADQLYAIGDDRHIITWDANNTLTAFDFIEQ